MTDYNPILNTDAYKTSHWKLYRENLVGMSSYLESRIKDNSTLFFGMNMALRKYFTTPITMDMVDEGEEFWPNFGCPYNRDGWEIIVNELEGKLPIEIQAVAEGSLVSTDNVLVQARNTDERFPWLVNYFETTLLSHLWYPTTVATISFQIRCIYEAALRTTGCKDIPAAAMYGLNDFGMRGATCNEAAGFGGAAHLVNFTGTDNAAGYLYAKRYYGADLSLMSIPAAEHSTICSWGRDSEQEAYQNLIDTYLKEGRIVSCVSDSYNLWDAIRMWGGPMRNQIMNSGGRLVVRPDSGDPAEISRLTVEAIGNLFGFSVNELGYKVLPEYIRVIYGDGINATSIQNILLGLIEAGWAAENIIFGMGGALLQKCNRDTFAFAFKANEGQNVDSDLEYESFDIYKDPFTANGTKTSKLGRQALIRKDNIYSTVRETELGNNTNYLSTVYRNGEIVYEPSFDNVRSIAAYWKNLVLDGTIKSPEVPEE